MRQVYQPPASQQAQAIVDAHESDPNAHGIGVTSRAVGVLEQNQTALLVALRNALSPTFTDTFDAPDAASLNATRWRAVFQGMPRIVGNAAMGQAGNLTCGAVRLGLLDASADMTVDVSAAGGEASLMFRFNTATSNYLLVQVAALGSVTVYGIVGTTTVLGTTTVQSVLPGDPLTSVRVEAFVLGTTLRVLIGGLLALTVTIPDALNTSANVWHGIRVSGNGKVLTYSQGGSDPNAQQRARLNTLLAWKRSTVLAKDTFDRADNASIGAAEVGGAWSLMLNKLPGIVSNGAQMSSGADFAVVAAAIGNGLFRAQISVPAATDYAGITLRFGTTGGVRSTRIERNGDGTVQMVRYNGAAYVTTLLGQRELSASPENLYVVAQGTDVWVLLDGHYVAYVNHPDDPATYTRGGISLKNTGRVLDFIVYAIEQGVLP
ncbi:hypothetical protein [Deinococcus soli (ex Cha et al. 2016)]|uniref:Uncharacterized protein n=1 Tax=Deinococcus soli (ex Cha et al. 2016) TaxID=1309411 RepID=A0ACC6KPP9_9DEIO|nr:hypothetical protein [Deinococcus soli (ex Cha et al. 2016)]MDR6330613.1 hypothetical protein [Deinococcus soli (ex Cha et al. 2016)]MDR6754390.1 hypothetical protein [Deinococcus soli (ex Cha et al. 2016)]